MTVSALSIMFPYLAALLAAPAAAQDYAPDLMDKLVSLCKRKGFIFQSSEIYGGVGAVYDYGPLGVELKNNLKAWWWQRVVRERAALLI